MLFNANCDGCDVAIVQALCHICAWKKTPSLHLVLSLDYLQAVISEPSLHNAVIPVQIKTRLFCQVW